MKRILLVGFLVAIAAAFLMAPSYTQFLPDIILTKRNGNWLDTRLYTTFGEVLTALNSSADPCTVVVIREETYDNDGTWPAYAEIVFRGQGSLTQTAGTLNMYASRINAPDRVVFSTTGTGSYDFADGSVVHSSWFDNFDDAVDITADDALTLQVDGWENVTSSKSLGDDVVLRFDNVGDFLYLDAGVVLDNVSTIEAGRYQVMRGGGRVDFTDGAELRTSWFERFDEAVRFADDSIVSILVDRSEVLVTTTTTNAGTALKWSSANLLTLQANLTVGGSIEASPHRIVYESGGVLSFSGQTEHVYPQWWGAIAGDGVDDDNYFQSAINATEDTGIWIKVPGGTYDFGTGITADNGEVFIKGAGPANQVILQTDDDITLLTIEGDADYSYIQNLNFCSASDTGTGLKLENVRECRVISCAFRDWAVGQRINANGVEASWYNKMTDCTYKSNDIGVKLEKVDPLGYRPNRNQWVSCIFLASASYHVYLADDSGDTNDFTQCDFSSAPVMIYAGDDNLAVSDSSFEGDMTDTNVWLEATNLADAFQFSNVSVSHGTWDIDPAAYGHLFLRNASTYIYDRTWWWYNSARTDTILRSYVFGEDEPYFTVQTQGKMTWGPGGSTVYDCDLVRSTTSTMQWNNSTETLYDSNIVGSQGFNADPITISGDTITVSATYHVLTAESGGVDDLDTVITDYAKSDSLKLIILRAASGNTITIKETGNFRLENSECVLDNTQDLFFGYVIGGPYVHEIACKNNNRTVRDYTVTNPVVDRAFDVSTVAVAELAKVVGTLITDLTELGVIE